MTASTTTTTTSSRRLYKVELEPALGSRFQPTGFPDIGAAEFQRPDPKRGEPVKALIVESAQSMANRLEGQAWDPAAQRPVALLDGLPYVRVVDQNGEYVTSSRTEAHRLASPFVKQATLDGESVLEVIKDRLALADDTSLSPTQIARAVMALDPLCLMHGVFFADEKWPGQPKIARAITGFIEAEGVVPVHSGGVKRDHVRHGNVTGGGSKEGFGSIPYHRTEYVADSITAYFSIDLAQIRSYGLGEAATDLLDTIARWEIRSFLDSGMRLRTACDLALADEGAPVQERSGETLPGSQELAERIAALIPQCKDLFGDGAPLDVVWERKPAKTKTK